MASRRKSFIILVPIIFLMICLLPVSFVRSVHAQSVKVRAVLFFSPTCPHCHKVMEQDLPPLVQKYGDQLEIVGVDIDHEVGSALYQSMLYQFNVPDDRIGVPTLVVGDQVLVGSKEIPEKFPAIIEKGLAAGGIDWPAIPGLEQVLAAQPPADSIQPASMSQAQTEESTPDQPVFIQRFLQDPIANTISVIVLIVMIGSAIGVGTTYLRGGQARSLSWPGWVIPLLSIAGAGVALYMSYIEITQSEAVCGPVGNCNSVQESPYAYLFGVIPVGVLGLLGYLAILVAWAIRQYGPSSLRDPAALAMWGMTWFGILFSIYLTFLEPFVIGASCVWCLTSAVIMTLTFLASTPPALQALKINTDEDEEESENLLEENTV